MRAMFARALVALLVTSALVALRGGSGAHLAAPSREVSPRLPGTEAWARRGEETYHDTRPLSVANHDVDAPARDTPRRRLCVIAPHRARVSGSSSSPGEPERFAAYLDAWLPKTAKVPREAFSVWVVEQADEYRFNRGWLMNAGIAVSRALDRCDVFALHDVDLLPVDARLPYGAFPDARVSAAEKAKGEEETKKEKEKTLRVGAAHLSPPGVHPEYVFPTFKGGAWMFTWDALVRVDGYAHVYWGWGLEDDDLGARLAKNADVAVATRPFRLAPRGSAALNKTHQCTGFARACARDPARFDCFANVPYETFRKRAFVKTPRTTREGLVVPEGRTLADGVCFAHAHEGAFSRDLLAREGASARSARPSRAFTRGREWGDVKSGRFRVDETTGLSRLALAGALDEDESDKGTKNKVAPPRRDGGAPPEPGHGFAVLGVDVVGVRVRHGVALVAYETRHPNEAVGSVLNDPAYEALRWSGNALLARAFAGARKRDAASAVARAAPSYPSFTRLRVRLTCDEDATPWCMDETREEDIGDVV